MPDFDMIFKLIEEKFTSEDIRMERIPIVQMLREKLQLGLAEAKQINDAHIEAFSHVNFVDGVRKTPTHAEQLAIAHGYWIAKEFKNIIASTRFQEATFNYAHLGLVRGLGY